jgi:CDP-glucose 4,6-dehydratase
LQLDTTLGWLVEWYKAWQGGADMQKYTMEQIAAYERLG